MPTTSKIKTTKLPQEPKQRFPKIDKRFLTILIGILLILLLIYASRSLIIVSVVNGQPITRLALIRELEKQAGKETLQSLVTRTLILQEAKKQGITVPNQEVDSRIKEVEDQVASQGGNLDQLLAARGQTRKDLKDQALVQLTIEALLKGKISVSDQEIEEYFSKNEDTYPKGTKLEEVKGEIGAQLRDQKLLQEFQSWIEGLRSNAKIIYFITY